jgi:hypothetical protein
MGSLIKTEERAPLFRLSRGYAPQARVGRRAQSELARDRLHARDDVRDVLVELEPEQLGARVDLVAMDAGANDGCFSFFLTDFGSRPSSPSGARARTRGRSPRARRTRTAPS